MNFLQQFVFDMKRVRVQVVNGEPWFVAKDVCEVLELGNTSMALTRLDDDERGLISTDTLGGAQQLATVNEPGLYTLVLGSRKPEAKKFKRWVTHEVIPSIRKTGSYSTQQPKSSAEMLLMMAQQFVEAEKRMQQVEIQLEVTRHRLDDLDRIDIQGDEQQRLNKLIRRYAQQNGLTFQKAWRDFTDRFNTAYHTNLTARLDNYRDKHGLRELTRPQYLSLAGQLQDAIRVADKMLNQMPVGV